METTVVAVKESVFSKYQVLVIAMLAVVQFTVILDFMVLSPLGAQLMLELNISAAQFGLVVSAYAFSAGASGLLAAGFADKSQEATVVFLFWFYCGHAFLRIGPQLSFPADGSCSNGYIWRGDVGYIVCHYYGFIQAGSSGAGNGLRTDGFCCQPGAGHPDRAIFGESSGLAFSFSNYCGSKRALGGGDTILYATGK
jgi:hypothetical protein